MKIRISAALATYNEEENLADCLKSIKELVDEIIIVDGKSTDRTREIAVNYGAKVTEVDNDPMFHKMKQQAFDLCSGDWVLYLDADERVSLKLAHEIKKITSFDDEEIKYYQQNIKNRKLFLKHQEILEKRDGKIGEDKSPYTAFFFPRANFFLGKYLRYGGVYPDGVIRLFKKDKAYLPCKDVHEQMVVKGRVGWLQNDLLHYADPNFQRYLMRNSRYIDLLAEDLRRSKVGNNPRNWVLFLIIKPINWFMMTLFRHKGLLDGYQGVIFSFFSALRFPRAYLRYLLK